MYLARIYSAALEIFRGRAWRAGIDRKLALKLDGSPMAANTANRIRIVARAWLHVIWRCWQNHQPYDPTRHRALQNLLHPDTIAA